MVITSVVKAKQRHLVMYGLKKLPLYPYFLKGISFD